MDASFTHDGHGNDQGGSDGGGDYHEMRYYENDCPPVIKQHRTEQSPI